MCWVVLRKWLRLYHDTELCRPDQQNKRTKRLYFKRFENGSHFNTFVLLPLIPMTSTFFQND